MSKHQCNCCDSIRHLETALEETAKLAATLKQERDEAREELVEWKVLNLWGGTPRIVHEFVKGQQMRIWEAQEIEKTCEQLERERDEARIQEDIHYRNFLQMERERDKARASALYYRTRYELLSDSINVFAEKTEAELDAQKCWKK